MTKILAIGPHPDDVEGGMGGTILRLTKLGHEVHILDLTDGEPTPYGNPETRLKESKEAAALLGISSRTILDLPNRFLFDNVESRQKVAEVIRKIRPDIMFLPYWEDAHPDHIQGTLIGEAARFYAKVTSLDIEGEPCYPSRIFYYLCTHLRIHIDPSFIIDVSEEHEKKIQILKVYRSQFTYSEERWNLISTLITSYDQYYGTLIRRQFGEPFISREKIGLKDIRDLV